MDKKTSMTFTLDELCFIKEALEIRIIAYYDYGAGSPDYCEENKERVTSQELSIKKIIKRLEKHNV